MNRQRGFVFLVELMIVLAVIGILASIAGPNLLARQTRVQVSNALALVSRAQLDAATYFTCTGHVPATLADLPQFYHTDPAQPCAAGSANYGGGMASDMVTSVSTTGQGDFTLTLGNNINPVVSGKKITLYMVYDGSNNVSWICGTKSVPVGLTVLDPAPVNTVPISYLPANCH